MRMCMRVSLTIDTLVAMASDDPDRLGRTSLHYAALDGPVDQVRNLLASGANVSTSRRQTSKGSRLCTSHVSSTAMTSLRCFWMPVRRSIPLTHGGTHRCLERSSTPRVT